MADPVTGPITVVSESLEPDALATGEPKGLTEGPSVVAEPRPMTIASSTTVAAAHGEPSEIAPPKNDMVKISLNQTREKLAGMSAQAGAGGASGNRISVVNDSDKR
jgi:hypothetical protein